jgi:protein-arginine kinase activator protein McsA
MIQKATGRPPKRKTAPPEKEYRVCKNCPRKFRVFREDHFFCSDECRKEYHRHGYPNYRRMRDDLRRELGPLVEEKIRPLLATIEAQAAKIARLESAWLIEPPKAEPHRTMRGHA